MANNLNFFVFGMGLLICGTFNSLIAKLIYGLQSSGIGGHVHYFRKPWFQTTNMFLGMILCMGLYHLKLIVLARLMKARRPDPEMVPLLVVETPPKPGSPELDVSFPDDHHKRGIFLVMFVSVADLAATGLMFSGLVFTTASVYQMLRGAEVIFCAVLSVIFLKHHLDPYMKAGILITVLGISLVGFASVMRGTTGAEEHFPIATQLFGIFLIVVAQLLQAIQMIIEEWLLQDGEMDALQLAGWEGIWGGILCVAVILPLFQTIPGPDMGSLENTEDSLLMLRNGSPIVLAEVLNCLSVLTYNYFGLTLTQDFTAMHRVIIEASRSLLVWICDLLIFYAFTKGTLGESWTWSSWIQLGGFFVLLVGTYVYNYTTLHADEHLSEATELLQQTAAAPEARTASVASRASRASTRSSASARLPHH
eukprot:GGOE01019216.1.p1 GENE.GGOE01019216.1~~GGOE01019216.1.p1  ORF type:complete len:430 (-),score=142.30 GGOE01019216.1:200-1465(-)